VSCRKNVRLAKTAENTVDNLISTLQTDLMSVLTNVVSEGISHGFDQFSKNMGAFFASGKGGGVTSLVSPLITARTLTTSEL
jgi:hypothetical protein